MCLYGLLVCFAGICSFTEYRVVVWRVQEVVHLIRETAAHAYKKMGVYVRCGLLCLQTIYGRWSQEASAGIEAS